MGKELKEEDYSFALEVFLRKIRVPYRAGAFFYTAVFLTLDVFLVSSSVQYQYQWLELQWSLLALAVLIFWLGLKWIRDSAVSTLNQIRGSISSEAWITARRLLTVAFKSRVQLVVPFLFWIGGSLVVGLMIGFIKGFEWFIGTNTLWAEFYTYNPGLTIVRGCFLILTGGFGSCLLGMVLYSMLINAVVIYVAGRGVLVKKVRVWNPDMKFGFSPVGRYSLSISTVWLIGGTVIFSTILFANGPSWLATNWWVLASLVAFFLFAVTLFLVPLYSYRRILLGIKKKRIDELSEYYEKNYGVFRGLMGKMSERREKDVVDEVEKISGVISWLGTQMEKLRRVSYWPIDTSTWKRFATSVILSVVFTFLAPTIPLLGLFV